MTIQVKIKKLHPDSVIPQYAKPGDAGMDLTAVNITVNKSEDFMGTITVDSGLAVEIPEGYVGLIFPRSSIYKNNTVLSNSVGVIDSGYRGSINAVFLADEDIFGYKIGDRFAQLMILPYPQVIFKEVEELSITERGNGGYGSTGN